MRTCVTIAVTFILLAGLTVAARADTHTWSGGGTTNNWSDPYNWAGNTAPEANDLLVFPVTSRRNAYNDYASDTAFGSISFSGYTGAWDPPVTISGNSIVLNGDLVNQDSSGRTIALDKITLGTSVKINAQSQASALTINSPIELGSNKLTLINYYHGSYSFNGAITGTGSVATQSITGTYYVYFNNPGNSYSGGTTVGSEWVYGSTETLQGNYSGHTLIFTNTEEGAFNGTANMWVVKINSSAPVIFDTPQTITGFGGGVSISSGTLKLGADDIFNVCGLSSGVYSAGGVLDMNGHRLTVSGYDAWASCSIIGGPGSVLTAGSFLMGGDGTVTASLSGTGALTKNRGGTLTMGGTHDYSGGTNVVLGTLLYANSDPLLDSGSVTVSGGFLDIGQ